MSTYMPMNIDNEMLTVYDERLNPIGERARDEVHAEGYLHRTVRLWTITDGHVWFQRRSLSKRLFPGRYDLSATGHVSAGETPDDAVLRELKEETGLELSINDLTHAGDIPFPFTRPDGNLDNEFASIYILRTYDAPRFRTSDEVIGFAAVSLDCYASLIRTKRGIPVGICNPGGIRSLIDCAVPATAYAPAASGGRLARIGDMVCTPGDFCCLNADEWNLVRDAIL